MTTEQQEGVEAAPTSGRAVGSPKTMLIAASIPSALSLVWTAWSIADMIPAPLGVGLAAGIALDVALVGAIAIAWVAPTAARGAQAASWLIAGIASAAIGVHSWEITPPLALMAAVPLAAKGLWGLALGAHHARLAEAAKAAAEEAAAARKAEQAEQARQARLSSELTEEQQEELAELDRRTAYVTARAQRQIALKEAEAMAAQAERIAAIERDAQVQMATVEATAQVRIRRSELEERLELSRPLGRSVPDDLSALEALGSPSLGEPPMGFGAALAQARSGETGETGPDLHEQRLTPVRTGETGETGPDLPKQRGPHHLARTRRKEANRARILAVLEQHPEAGPREVSSRTGIAYETVRSHIKAMKRDGLLK